ncbi:polysaccharide lyase family 8 super-sandwich domain-containing protein [Bacteroides propionicifaciens]|uniref:polysaccharide lyase family 8 super-sandwich domain-containing protein n=2 Tax=Bacteroides propionicifaciens TaxID=392838 RepID=UPI000379DBF1|nr:polysaccharide lyase family 8 super-sandwich domain-containing protein [Bacteroides propionicifaciens]
MTVNSNLAYTSTVGEAQLMSKLLDFDIAAEKPVSGSLFMPYSGTLIQKDERFQFNAKGYSRFIWDFESSDSENLKGRYVSNGHLEFFDLKSGRKSFNPLNKDFDWNYISGTTVRVLPDDQLMDKGGSSSGHRHFTDETFLAGWTC